MPDTLDSLLVLVVAVVPGILFKTGYESLLGPWGTRAADRLLRVVATSAVLHAIASPLTYWLWHTYLRKWPVAPTDFPLWFMVVPFTYVAIPYVLGRVASWLTRRGWLGRDPYPSAREYLLGFQREGWVRLRQRGGRWLAGSYGLNDESGLRGYASQYGEEEADLLLTAQLRIDEETGDYIFDDYGNYVTVPTAAWVPWDTIEYLEFDRLTGGTGEHGERQKEARWWRRLKQAR